jgi:peptidoglycan/xylan/chitin deacetylase (PgdA/CDA1 family)
VAPASDWAHLPDRNFYLSLGFLDELLETLISTGWEIVTIDRLLERLKCGAQGSRLINFSADDCYRDTFELTVPVFRKHKVPVTLFVTTGIPDRTIFLGEAGLEAIIKMKKNIKLGGNDIDVSTPSSKRRWFRRIFREWNKGGFDAKYREFCTLNRTDPAKLDEDHVITWEMLETFRNDPLVEIGAHTLTHPRISDLPAASALREMAESGDRLRSRLGVPCRHFAFPYGRRADCGRRDFDLAEQAGFASASTTRKGLVRREQDVFSLPRNSLGGNYQSLAYVDAALSGAAGFAAKVLRRV